jgi:hypothetical protein
MLIGDPVGDGIVVAADSVAGVAIVEAAASVPSVREYLKDAVQTAESLPLEFGEELSELFMSLLRRSFDGLLPPFSPVQTL